MTRLTDERIDACAEAAGFKVPRNHELAQG